MKTLAQAVVLSAAWSVCSEAADVAGDGRTVHFQEPRQTRYVLVDSSGSGPQPQPGQVWTRARPEQGATNTVELGNRLVLQLAPGTDASTILTNRDLVVSRIIRSNLFILQAADSQAAIDAAETMAEKNGVISSYPVMRRSHRPHDAYAPMPDDPYFSEQWHLENRGDSGNASGPDLNVRAAWPSATGAGVVVAVADTGFQLDHPDLASRAASGLHYNFFKGTTDGSPYASDASHGTCVAGLVAAEAGNEVGVAGVAPQAQLASWVVFGLSRNQESIASDEQLMDMFEHESDRVAVQNHSWGNATTSQSPLDALSDSGIDNAVSKGRGGKGVVIVRAAGNDRDSMVNANDDEFASDPRVIAVAAVRKDGRACTYSNPGACVLVAAPSGDVLDTDGDGEADSVDPSAPDVLTTDRTGSLGDSTGSGDRANYAGFNGTSASSPQVAGIAALALSANTNLTSRDVQQILILGSRHFDLADPDLRTNGAGFRISHNQGFGVPDAGVVADLAKNWSNRPAATRISLTNAATQAIPDDALRVVCSGSGLAASLASIRCLPSLGPHPDDATAALPLVYVGQAGSELSMDLHGKAALIQRGGSYFYEKIERASRAGAAFAIIFNNVGTSEIQAMGATDYVPIPAVSIGLSNGEALRDYIASYPAATARLQLAPAATLFNVTNTLICEHVGVRLKTTHTSRMDVRVTLVSPMGTRSVLQAINIDTAAGPTDWMYWSARHFFESSAGQWRLEVSDERSTTVRTSPFASASATGSVTYAELMLDGVPIVDTDRDGLDDSWELAQFGHLEYGPKDDPDGDGYNNAREQVMGTDAAKSNLTGRIDVASLKLGYLRLSWPAVEGASCQILSGQNLIQPLSLLTNLSGVFPTTELVLPVSEGTHFFKIQ